MPRAGPEVRVSVPSYQVMMVRLPEQSHLVVQRSHQQVRVSVPIHILSSRERVTKRPEPRRHAAALDHLGGRSLLAFSELAG